MDCRWINTNGGNWSDGANWSTGSKPTSGDNAIVDAASFNATGKTITINETANCLNFDCSAADVVFTLANSAYAFNVYGSLTLHTNLTVSFTSTGYLYMKATDSRTITTNGKVANFNRIYFDGVGGIWTNSDNMDLATSTILTNGTWNTNNKKITLNVLETASGTKTWNLGSSVIVINRFYNNQPTNLLINIGTSTFSPTQAAIDVLPVPYYNLYYTSPDWTFYTLSPLGNITITNELRLNGYSSYRRAFIASGTIGSQRTITVDPAKFTASNVDFRDIRFINPVDLSAITGGSGDCGGNSGITFTPALTQYYKHTSGACNWSDSTKWFSDQAKTIAGRVPLPQDDATFDSTSFTGSSTLSVNCPRIGRSLDMSGVNQVVTFTLANSIECYGSFVLGSNITYSTGYNILLYGIGNFIFNSYGKINQTTGELWFMSGNYVNMSNIKCFAIALRGLNSAVLDFNDYNISCGYIWISVGTAYLGNGLIEITYGLGVNGFTANNNTYPEGCTIKYNPISGTSSPAFLGNGKTFNKIWFSGSHTGNFNISGSNTISELIIDSGRKVRFTAGTNQTIGKLTAIGTEAAPITISSVTAAQHTLTKTGAGVNEIKYCNISYSNAVGGFTAENSVDGGNNSGWVFITGYKMYIGALQVQKLYLGSTLVTTAYLGSNQLK